MTNPNKTLKDFKNDKHLMEIKILEILNRFNLDYGVSLTDIKFNTSTKLGGLQDIISLELDYKL